jgi:hypothetical protein
MGYMLAHPGGCELRFGVYRRNLGPRIVLVGGPRSPQRIFNLVLWVSLSNWTVIVGQIEVWRARRGNP